MYIHNINSNKIYGGKKYKTPDKEKPTNKRRCRQNLF